MHNARTKWRADHATRALKRMQGIEAAIAALQDEDLLDLADIFAGQPGTPLQDLVSAEMMKRNISL